MNHKTKAMIWLSIVLLILLVSKSLWLDPVKGLEGELLKYKDYAQSTAPLKTGALIWDSTIFTYEVVSVKQTTEEGSTKIKYQDQKGEWHEEELQGEYTAKVRSYIFRIFPVRDIRIKGGVNDGK
ncbi:hypothetical protein [Alkaliphilus hydrothermalis]|nr:hypothetical protein [Alkaliphilus hydrothermalis]